jgi:ABC-type phosphate/phosphonate transport system ATPase subunit
MMLQLSELKKRYDTGDYALKGVSLEVPKVRF